MRMQSHQAQPVAEIRDRIRAVVDGGGRVLVEAYYRPGKKSFAGALFDTLGENLRDSFSSDDVLAASLLDVRFSRRPCVPSLSMVSSTTR